MKHVLGLGFGVLLLVSVLPPAAESQPLKAPAPSRSSGESQPEHVTLLKQRLTENVFARLQVLLKKIPERWNSIPAPKIPVSGRSPDEVLAAATEEEAMRAAEWAVQLSSSSPADRKALLEAKLDERNFSEVDIWIQANLVAEFRTETPVLAALFVEAWLQWAEALGRRDVLFSAASLGIYLLVDQKSTEALEIAEGWLKLQGNDSSIREKAYLLDSLAFLYLESQEYQKARDALGAANALFEKLSDFSGQGRCHLKAGSILHLQMKFNEALESYRLAKIFFERVDDPKGQGDSYAGQALSLYELSEKQKALDSYRKARELYERADFIPGQGTTNLGEAIALFDLGELESSMTSVQKARPLLEQSRDLDGLATTVLYRAKILARRGDNQQALPLFQEARKLYESTGNLEYQGHSYIEEGRILLLRAEIDSALDAFLKARSLHEKSGSLQGQGVTYLGEAQILLAQGGHRQQAVEVLTKARELFEVSDDKEGLGSCYSAESQIRALEGEYIEALDLIHKARRLLTSAGSPSQLGFSYLQEAYIQFILGENQQSLAASREALRIFSKIGEPIGIAYSLIREAYVARRLGDNRTSLNLFREAVQITTQTGAREGQAEAFLGEATVLFRLESKNEALERCQQALEIFKRIEHRYGLATSYGCKGGASLGLGQFEDAMKAFEHYHRLSEELGMKYGQAEALLGKARVLYLLRRHEQAKNFLEEARPLFEYIGDRWGVAASHKLEGEILFSLNELQEAAARFRKSREVFASIEDLEGQADVQFHEALVFEALKEHDKAYSAYAESYRLSTETGNVTSTLNSLLGQASVLLAKKEWAEACKIANLIIADEKRFVLWDDYNADVTRFFAWNIRAACERGLGYEALAADAVIESRQFYERTRGRYITEALRINQDLMAFAGYDILVSARLRQGRLQDALTGAEEARSRTFLDKVLTNRQSFQSITLAELLANQRQLNSELAITEAQMLRATDRHHLEELQNRRRLLGEELEWNYYQGIAEGRLSLLVADPLEAAGIQTLSQITGPILIYYAAENELFGFLVHSEAAKIVSQRIEISRESLSKLIREFTYDLANPLYTRRAQDRARAAWDLLIAPFADHLPAKGPLVLVPHGPLHELPFAALLDPGGAPLFERWDVSVTPSVSALAFARERHRERLPTDSFLAFASGRGLDLPEEEIAAIAPLFDNGKAFRSTPAYFENYEQQVTRASHLLIATQGVHVPGSRRDTYLEILPTPGAHDSRLSAAEIAAIPLQAELVTLAACETARGEAMLSDERLDLTRAFLIAGAASVLATRWKVPEDPATSQLLLDFYQAYRQGGPEGQGLRKDEALGVAMRRSRERGDPAQLWAAWVLVGDPR